MQSLLRYPPDGVRGFGPFIAQSRWDTSLPEYAAKMQDNLVCVLLIETGEAVENIEEICKVPGTDVIVPAQFDPVWLRSIAAENQSWIK